MNRSLIVGLVAGALALTCVCLPVSAVAGFAVISKVSANQSSNVSKAPVTSPKPPTSPVSAPVTTPPGSGGGNFIDFLVAPGVADSFLKALRDGDDKAAYALLSPDAQQEIVDANGLGKLIDDNALRPTTWAKWEIKSDTKDGHTIATVSTTVTYKNGGTGPGEFRLSTYDGKLRIDYFRLRR